MGVVHGGGWFIRSSHVALIYSPKPRIYFIHYAFPGAEKALRGGGPWLEFFLSTIERPPGGRVLSVR